MRIFLLLSATLALSFLLGRASAARAAEGAEPAAAPAPPAGKKAPAKARGSKGRRPREKETEGTEARNRFQADTVLKSKYELNGQPLEVDPD